MIASGPYATDVNASSDSADSPSTGVICSLDASRTRSGGPIRKRHADGTTPRLCNRRFGIFRTVGEPSTSLFWRFIEEVAEGPICCLVLRPDRAGNLLEHVVTGRPRSAAVIHTMAR